MGVAIETDPIRYLIWIFGIVIFIVFLRYIRNVLLKIESKNNEFKIIIGIFCIALGGYLLYWFLEITYGIQLYNDDKTAGHISTIPILLLATLILIFGFWLFERLKVQSPKIIYDFDHNKYHKDIHQYYSQFHLRKKT